MIWYLAEHWRGHHGLGTSYWLNGFLGGIAALLITVAIGYAVRGSMNPAVLLAAMDASYAVILIVSVWQIVGIWRSARRHKARTGRKLWATAAQVTVVLSVLQSGYLVFNAGRQSVEFGRIIAATDPQTAATFFSQLSAIPSSVMVRATTAAPYFLAALQMRSRFLPPSSRLMELMIARPG